MSDRAKPKSKPQSKGDAGPAVNPENADPVVKSKAADPAAKHEDGGPDANHPSGPDGNPKYASQAGINARLPQSTERPRTGHRGLVVTLILLSLLFASCVVYLNIPPAGQQVSLDRVLRLTLQKKISSVTFLQRDARMAATGVIDSDNTPQGTRALDKPGPQPKAKAFWTSIPRSDATFNDIFKTFFSSGTHITIDDQTPKKYVHYLELLVLVLILANVFALARLRWGR